ELAPAGEPRMIDFTLTEEQREFQRLAQDFARNEMRPVAAHHDRTGEFPAEVFRKAWKLGLLNVHVPLEYGGLGLGTLDNCIMSASKASWYFVVCYTEPELRHQGMSGFIVPADTPGIEVGAKEWNMGQRASDTRGVSFTDVVVSSSLRLGAENEGWRIAMAAF